jgi:uncharacterized membrane protein (DUF4010 family)
MITPLDSTLALRLVVALAIGFLVGLEREGSRRVSRPFFFGGVRTYPILSLFGFGCAWLFGHGATAVLPAGLLAVAAVVGVAYLEKIRSGRFGATSEMSALLTYIAGALALLADVRLAMAIGVINTMLLSEKSTLERYVERLDRAEFLATVKFLLVTAVIYPALPDTDYTAYRINPRKIWQIVMLVSAIGFAGYLLMRKLGPRLGLALSGLLGGIVSSTAVSVAAGRIARENPALARTALQASLLASSVMYVRLVVLLAVFGGPLLWQAGGMLLSLAVAGFLMALTVAPAAGERGGGPAPVMQNPIEIRVAVLFALVFVGLKVATGVARARLGDAGVMALAGLAGLADVDPFVLSIMQGPAMQYAVSAILVAVLVNTLAKGAYFAVASRGGAKAALSRYGIWAALHVLWLVAPLV